tara:strand:- start:474 stop:794 length:321 start_codon:yes stop_codon:yes gene_type:complete
MSYYNLNLPEYHEELADNIEYSIFEHEQKDGFNYIAKLRFGKQTIAIGQCINHTTAVHWIEDSIQNIRKKRDFKAIVMDDFDLEEEWKSEIEEPEILNINGVDIYV